MSVYLLYSINQFDKPTELLAQNKFVMDKDGTLLFNPNQIQYFPQLISGTPDVCYKIQQNGTCQTITGGDIPLYPTSLKSQCYYIGTDFFRNRYGVLVDDEFVAPTCYNYNGSDLPLPDGNSNQLVMKCDVPDKYFQGIPTASNLQGYGNFLNDINFQEVSGKCVPGDSNYLACAMNLENLNTLSQKMAPLCFNTKFDGSLCDFTQATNYAIGSDNVCSFTHIKTGSASPNEFGDADYTKGVKNIQSTCSTFSTFYRGRCTVGSGDEQIQFPQSCQEIQSSMKTFCENNPKSLICDCINRNSPYSCNANSTDFRCAYDSLITNASSLPSELQENTRCWYTPCANAADFDYYNLITDNAPGCPQDLCQTFFTFSNDQANKIIVDNVNVFCGNNSSSGGGSNRNLYIGIIVFFIILVILLIIALALR
jgi:hypothetical protein